MIDNSQILISVIMPVYNSALWVKQTLDCVCLNSHKNLEVIVILDKPQDGSDDIVKEYAKLDPRLKVIEQPENKGQSAARNLGLSVAKGEYVHFMDSDDLIGVHFYKNMLAAAKLTDVDAALCSDITHEASEYRVTVPAPMVMSNFGDIVDSMRDVVIAPWAWLLRRSFLEKQNFSFPEEVRIAEDYMVMPVLIDKMDCICTAPETFYIYKKRQGSVLIGRPKEDSEAEKEMGYKMMIVDDLAQMRGANYRYDIYRVNVSFGGKLVILHRVGGTKDIILFGKKILTLRVRKK